MRYDTIVIGGGFGGLLSGIRLAQQGRRVAIISAGKSALHFCSGSLEMWSGSYEEMEELKEKHPLHPYNIVGRDRLERYTPQVKEIFRRAGVNLVGEYGKNHYRLTPIGGVKPAWLTMDEYATFESADVAEWRKVVVVTFEGYLDFYPDFIAAGLQRRGVECRVESLVLPELERLRESATEMRAVNISRVMRGEVLDKLAQKIVAIMGDADMVLLPAVFGLADGETVKKLGNLVGRDVRVAPTVSASVPGVRAQRLLSEEFTRLGGQLIQGDRVNAFALNDKGEIESLCTVNHSDIVFRAENYILATGSFFGRGLVATPDEIVEPIFGLDIYAKPSREEWCGEKILGEQPFQRFGVTTDNHLHPSIAGRKVENLYAVGAVLAGADAVKEGCGAGVVVATALMAAEEILGEEKQLCLEE